MIVSHSSNREYETVGDLLELVEDLQPDKRVEDEGSQTLLLVLGDLPVGVGEVVTEERGAGEVENKSDGKLTDGLADDHLHHAAVDEPGRLLIRLPVENRRRRRICGEGKGGEGVHDEVDPEKLNRVEHGLLLVAGNSRHEGQDHGGNVDGQLEL